MKSCDFGKIIISSGHEIEIEYNSGWWSDHVQVRNNERILDDRGNWTKEVKTTTIIVPVLLFHTMSKALQTAGINGKEQS